MHIDYYLSLGSPWTHLGAARTEALATQHGATIRPIPCDFGGTVFPASGGLPLAKRSPQRQAYRMQELRRWRDALEIPIQVQPRHFPADEAFSAACVIAVRETQGDAPALRLSHRILKALWEEEADTADRETLGRLVGESGLDAAVVMTLAEDERWAAMRRSDSEAALARGVFGAPTYVIGQDIFWGQDRLDFVARRLAQG